MQTHKRFHLGKVVVHGNGTECASPLIISKCVGLGVAPFSSCYTGCEHSASGEKRFQEQSYNPFIPSRNYKNFITAYLSAELLKANLS